MRVATSKNVGKGIYDFVPSVYHPASFDYYETAFIEFLVNSCESILAISPECKVIYC